MCGRRIIPPSHKTMCYGFTDKYSVIPKEDVEKLIARVSEKDSLNRDDFLESFSKDYGYYILNLLPSDTLIVKRYKNIYKKLREE